MSGLAVWLTMLGMARVYVVLFLLSTYFCYCCTQLLHDRLYYILRPVRLAMVSILPVLDKVNLNFLDTDCMLENPLLSDAERCACFGIKYPQEIDLEFSALPQHLSRAGIQDIYVLRNSTRFDKDLNIMNFVKFRSEMGDYPLSCHQMSGENIGIFRYDEFFQEEKMTELLTRGDSWSFSWFVILFMFVCCMKYFAG